MNTKSFSAMLANRPKEQIQRQLTAPSSKQQRPVSPAWDINGIPVMAARYMDLRATLMDNLRHRHQTVLLFANMHFLIQCQPLADALQSEDVMIVNDGVAVSLAARLLYGRSFPENLNGTDCVPRLLTDLGGSVRVYLLGSRVEAVEGSARCWSQLPAVEIVGTCDGYTLWSDEEAIIAEINHLRPDILLVALGNPLQERWILRHRARLAPTLIVGVGALFDFASGRVPRAPGLMQHLRLEWLFRLVQEPRRLFARYSLGAVRFAARCILQRLGMAGQPSSGWPAHDEPAPAPPLGLQT